MKKTILSAVAGMIGIALFIGLIYSAGPKAIWLSIQKISPVALVLFIGISIVNFLLFTLRWKLILRTSDTSHISVFTLTWYHLVTYAVSYLIPRTWCGWYTGSSTSQCVFICRT
ncbi:MAG: lysylphosphatidylglycerol synthase domain-containing protein [bacterium]|nr:lysylphosphatidylglycerol synthase domain-containing protein [bacterium]